MHKSRVRGLIAALLAGLLLFAVTPVASAQPTSDLLTEIPVTESLPGGEVFEGTLSITEFVIEDGQLLVSGVLEGTITDTTGEVINVTQQFTRVVADLTAADGVCDILMLDIGAIHLDLLGLVVDLSPISLDVTAESGPGNLLGNLLCAVAGLLDNGGGIQGAINGLLRTINRILGSL